MAQQIIAVLKGGKITEIIPRKVGKKIVRDCERLIDVTRRPDLKIGDTWPFSPDPNPPSEQQE